jgi:catechol 2,3-dioxygenase-like lactoylglutathione lyase family enzyme
MFTGWHHTNIVVSDLDRAVDFHTRILGLEVASEIVIDDAEFSRGVGIPGTKVRGAFLEVPGTTTVIELFEYMTSDSRPLPEDARPSDIGVGHICFSVSDIDAVYEKLSAAGVKFKSSPVTISKDHPQAGGVRFCYFHDPDGTLLEILQAPS